MHGHPLRLSSAAVVGEIAGVATGPKKSPWARALAPVLTIASLAGTVGAITAAINK